MSRSRRTKSTDPSSCSTPSPLRQRPRPYPDLVYVPYDEGVIHLHPTDTEDRRRGLHNTLMGAYGPRILRSLASRWGWDEAADGVQGGGLALWKYYFGDPECDETLSTPYGLFYCLSRHAIIRGCRKKRVPADTLAIDPIDTQDDLLTRLEIADEYGRVSSAIDQLSLIDQNVLRLRLVVGMSAGEIAAKYKVSPSAICNRIARATCKLKGWLA